MRILFHLGHPAHFHLFKNVIQSLKDKGHTIAILIKKKDILEDLLKASGLEYINILPKGRKDSKFGIALGVIESDYKILRFSISFKPNLLIGTSYAISHVGKLLRIPSINLNEDDSDIVPLYSKLSYPWASVILSPNVCNNGKWNKKTIKYNGYHELTSLHPNHFSPSIDIVKKYIPIDKPFFLFRFAKLNAHHDKGIRGINDDLAFKIIEVLKPYGNIYITSERKFDEKFEPFRLHIDPFEIHHVMAFATIYIGDSQTMAAEAGVLGTPFIRFNDFVGRIGYLNDLENNYSLGYGIKPNETEKLFQKIEELVSTENLMEIFSIRRKKMLSEKIDVTAFIVWFIENYPKSVSIMKAEPDYQYHFK